MNRSVLVPSASIVLAVLSLGLGVYEYAELGRLHARIAQVAEAPPKLSDSAVACETRLRALESRVTQLSSGSPGTASVATTTAAATLAASRGLPGSPADQLLAHETTRQLMEAARASSLDLVENRRTWIHELATAEGLSPDKAAQLGDVFEAEFQRRDEVIALVKLGTRTRKDGRAELQRLEAASSERARAILGADLFEKYLARRVASGIHDDGAAQ